MSSLTVQRSPYCSPTAIGTWAMVIATGGSASTLTLVGWIVSMAVLVVGAKLVFDRQEF